MTNNNRSRSILDAAYDSFVAMNQDGLITDWNFQAERTFGWSKAEAIGKPLHDVIIPERYRAAHVIGMAHFLRTGEGPALGKRLELSAICKDGEEIPVELTITPVKEAGITYFGAFLKDISERRRTEVATKVQLEVTRALIGSTSANEAIQKTVEILCMQYGWSWGAYWEVNEELMQMSLFQRFMAAGKDLRAFEAASKSLNVKLGQGFIGRAWSTRSALWLADLNADETFLRKDSAHESRLHGAIAVPHVVDNKVRGVFEFLTAKPLVKDEILLLALNDISMRVALFVHRKHTEENFRKSEAQFSRLVEEVRDYAIIGLDPNGCVTGWNEGAAHITGYSFDEISGKHFSAFYPDELIREHAPDKELEAVTKYGKYEAEGWRIRKDGSRFWANVVVTRIEDDDSKLLGFAKITRDLTERRLADEKLRSANESLEQKVEDRTNDLQKALKVRDEFLSIASHELKTPLTTLSLQLQMADRSLRCSSDPKEKEISNSLQGSLKQVKSLVALVEDLLDVTKIETGNFTINPHEMDLSNVVEELLTQLGPQGKAAECNVKALLHKPLTGIWDQQRLEQVITNLITNAFKYAPRASVTVSTFVRSDEAWIIVADSGPGIPMESQAKIFERFERAPETKKVAGLGLGLFIVKRIVEAHGGSISVESKPGHGSKFIVRLPLD